MLYSERTRACSESACLHMSDEPALEIGRRRNTDRSYVFYEHHVLPRLHELQRSLNVYRFRIAAALCLGVFVWFFYLLWVLADPVDVLFRESVLERTLNIELLNVDKSTLRRYKTVADFWADAGMRRACVEVPLEELQRGRTAATASGQHHALSNLRDLCRHVMQHEQLAFVTPKMLASSRPPPDACVLSIILSSTTMTTDETHIIDMVNPQEIELGDESGGSEAAAVQVQFRDLLFKDAPLVWVDLKPSLHVRYRQLNGDAHVLKLTGGDAYMMRSALKLMHDGLPVSMWHAVAPPPPPTRPKQNDEL